MFIGVFMTTEPVMKKPLETHKEENQLGLIDIARSLLIEMNKQLKQKNMYAERSNQLAIVKALECVLSRH